MVSFTGLEHPNTSLTVTMYRTLLVGFTDTGLGIFAAVKKAVGLQE
jgi:hypothetical protein